MEPKSPHNDNFFMYCELKLLNPKMTLFDFNVKKEFWSFLIPENLSKITFFWIELRKSTQNNIFFDQVKISQNDNYFFGQFFQRKKKQ